MTGWQQRVITERDQLHDRVCKLSLFLASLDFVTLNPSDAILLREQLAAMLEYRSILNERIKRFSNQ